MPDFNYEQTTCPNPALVISDLLAQIGSLTKEQLCSISQELSTQVSSLQSQIDLLAGDTESMDQLNNLLALVQSLDLDDNGQVLNDLLSIKTQADDAKAIADAALASAQAANVKADSNTVEIQNLYAAVADANGQDAACQIARAIAQGASDGLAAFTTAIQAACPITDPDPSPTESDEGETQELPGTIQITHNGTQYTGHKNNLDQYYTSLGRLYDVNGTELDFDSITATNPQGQSVEALFSQSGVYVDSAGNTYNTVGQLTAEAATEETTEETTEQQEGPDNSVG